MIKPEEWDILTKRAKAAGKDPLDYLEEKGWGLVSELAPKPKSTAKASTDAAAVLPQESTEEESRETWDVLLDDLHSVMVFPTGLPASCLIH